MNVDILRARVELASEALGQLAEVSQRFEKTYRATIEACKRLRLPLTLCTIYNGASLTLTTSG